MNATHRRCARILAIAIACAPCVLGAASEARAADPVPRAGAAQSGDADQLFEQGVAARKAGKLAEAEELFLKAWAQKKTWDIAANLGMVELKQGKLAGGAGHVAYAIANLPPTESDATRESLTKALDAARPEIGEVKLICDLEGATVRAGGKLVGTTPLGASFFVTPGSVTIEVTKDGYEPATKTLEIKKGGSEEVKLTPVPRSVPERSKVPAYVVGGVAVAGAALGAGLLVASRDKYDATEKTANDIRAQKKSCVAGAANFDARCTGVANDGRDVNTLRDAGIVSLAVAGAAAAGAAIYVLWPASKPAASAVRVAPIASDTTAGVVLSGRF